MAISSHFKGRTDSLVSSLLKLPHLLEERLVQVDAGALPIHAQLVQQRGGHGRGGVHLAVVKACARDSRRLRREKRPEGRESVCV